VYLFGKKPGEKGWRFSGGFKDRNDPNFEAAVWREAGEEVLKKGKNGNPVVDPQTVFDAPQYICSRNVNDWRYKGELDGITTLFYLINFTGDESLIEANDDLAETAWFELSQLCQADIEGEHIFLFQALCEYEKTHMLTCDCGIPPTQKKENLPDDHLWVITENGLGVAYAPPQELKVVRLTAEEIENNVTRKD
jgi:hypothetical protein